MGSYSAEEYFYKVDNMVLSSCQQLRKLFQTRWKKETGRDWEHTEEQGKIFIEGVGKTVFKKANKLQKAIIAKGCLDEWDMTTLSMVLQNFGDQTEFEAENDAVKGLTRLRNDLAHHSTKKLTLAEYNLKVKSFRKSLLAICVKKEEIEKLIEKAGITSSVAALEATKKLYEQVEELLENENFEKAIEHLNEATTMPSLLPVHHGVAHEKRAECYMKLARVKNKNQMKDEGDSCCEQAMIDATIALELNDSSWNAHYILARCHRWQNNFKQAIQHYQKALAISPVQKQVKNELDACKALAGVRNREETTDTRNMPMSLAEALVNLESETGQKLTEEQFIKYKTEVEGKLFKGQDLVFRGHQYSMGWGERQNDEEAVKYYSKAAKIGNAEGLLNLGLCYRNGKGVTQDIPKAYKLYLQVGTMSPDTPGLQTKAKKNNGVASAQHYLGHMHEHGIVVEQDYCEAMFWYLKASKNGNGTSAYNLGLMFATGMGIPKDEKKAEMYWQQGVILEEARAAESLMSYYVHHLEPERARAMFETGKQLGSVGLSGVSDDEFDNLIQSAVRKRKECECDVLAYEKQKQLDIKGMTFLERIQRWIISSKPKHGHLLKNFQELFSKKNESWGGKVNAISERDLEQISRMAQAGSPTAVRVLATINSSLDLVNFLIPRDFDSFSENDKDYVLNLLYECCTQDFHVSCMLIFVFPGVKDKLKRLIGHLFDTKCDGRKSEEEMKIRFCYVTVNKAMALDSTDTFMTELLKQGVKMYPENLHYYTVLSNVYGLCRDHKSGLLCAEKGLEKFPDDPNLLYSKAGHLRLLPETEGKGNDTYDENMKKTLSAYNHFIRKAPLCHRQFPETYYTVACLIVEELYGQRKPNEVQSASIIDKIELYYQLGKEAESNMLPCYLPYGESSQRKAVELVLLLYKAEVEAKSISLDSYHPDINQSQDQTAHHSTAPSIGILERKQYLSNPERKRLILEHRRNISESNRQLPTSHKRSTITVNIPIQYPPKLAQTTPTRMSRVTPITLKEMNPTSDNIYWERMIDFTVVDDPCVGFGPEVVHLLVEDNNGDLSRLYLYKFNQSKDLEMVSFGCTIAILNPYMRIGIVDGTNGIRNDEPSCVVYLGKVENMCRFCAEENAARKCSKCKRAWYCSRECQKLDWADMNHKLICSN